MLSAIGRATARRVVAGGPQSTNRAFQSLWHLQPVASFHDSSYGSVRAKVSFSLGRSYATATKVATTPKTTKPKSKAKTGRPKKKLVAKKAKKPAKGAQKKAIAKKAVKKVVKKKKVLTEAQKEKLALKKKKESLATLKTEALTIPKKLPSTAWMILNIEHAKQNGVGGGRAAIGAASREAGSKYRNLSPAELESYNHTANQNKAANAIAFKQWVQSHSPEQIRIANKARAALKRKDPKHAWSPIPDERIPKRPTNSFTQFSKERYASGDFKGIAVPEGGALIAKEWAALSPSQRKAYDDLAAADRQRYTQEFKTVFHRDPEYLNKKTA